MCTNVNSILYDDWYAYDLNKLVCAKFHLCFQNTSEDSYSSGSDSDGMEDVSDYDEDNIEEYDSDQSGMIELDVEENIEEVEFLSDKDEDNSIIGISIILLHWCVDEASIYSKKKNKTKKEKLEEHRNYFKFKKWKFDTKQYEDTNEMPFENTQFGPQKIPENIALCSPAEISPADTTPFSLILFQLILCYES